jgi:anti-anti-sigma factor
MEIGLNRIGDIQVLSLKGSIRLQHWRVVDRHLEAMLEKGCRNLVLDLSEVTLLCTAGLGEIFHNVKRFRDRDGRLLLLSDSPNIRGLLESFGGEAFLSDSVCGDWSAVERRVARD